MQIGIVGHEGRSHDLVRSASVGGASACSKPVIERGRDIQDLPHIIAIVSGRVARTWASTLAGRDDAEHPLAFARRPLPADFALVAGFVAAASGASTRVRVSLPVSGLNFRVKLRWKVWPSRGGRPSSTPASRRTARRGR